MSVSDLTGGCQCGAVLNLRAAEPPLPDQERRERDDLLSAAIPVDDVDRLFSAFQEAGATFHQLLQDEAWGARTFIVRDPDGNLILFAGRK